MVRYLDASALLRVLFDERGPRVELGLFQSASSRVVEVEAFRAVDRARLSGDLTDLEAARKLKELADLIDALDRAPISDEVLALARATFPVNVRALDAIHVATAQVLKARWDSKLEFWTHDARQATAALARGLTVQGL